MPSGIWLEAGGINQAADKPDGLSFICANILKPTDLKKSLPSHYKIGILKDLKLTDTYVSSRPE